MGAKLYIEGMEVPFIGATVTCQVGTASIAYIDVVPHAEINHIKPRTHVLLVVRDFHDKNGGFPYVKMWEGEVFGYSFSKTPQSRSMTLSCIDFTSYWDNVLTYYFNPATTLANGDTVSLPVGIDVEAAKKMGINVSALPTNIETYFYTKMRETIDKKGDLFEAIVHMIGKISEINPFYKAAEARLKISQRLAMKSSDAISQLLPQQAALSWFNQIANEGGGFQTLRHTVNELISLLFHDQVTIPFPSTVTTKEGWNYLEYLFKPNMFMISPPACNIFFPDEYSSYSFSRNFLLEPTRLMYCPEAATPAGGTVALPASYAPENLARYMFGPGFAASRLGKDYTPTGDFGVSGTPGRFGESLSGNEVSQYKREQHFLTNEERMRGILFSRENLVPASNEFKAFLNDDQRGDFSQKIAQYMLIKKRYQTRELQVTSHLKPSVIPGFSALILDDSPAGQSMVAYVSSVTHRIYATEGGYTNVSLSYARTVSEQESSSENKDDPLIPPWFAETIFGSTKKVDAPKTAATTLGDDKVPKGKEVVPGPGLAGYYKALIGDKGSKPVTAAVDGKGIYAAAANYLAAYRKVRDSGEDVLDYISTVTDREYVPVRKAFSFLGATLHNKNLAEAQFSEATGGPFDPKADASSDADPLSKSLRTAQRQVAIRYRNKLKQGRGFRG